jgi:hypothetical protein
LHQLTFRSAAVASLFVHKKDGGKLSLADISLPVMSGCGKSHKRSKMIGVLRTVMSKFLLFKMGGI